MISKSTVKIRLAVSLLFLFVKLRMPFLDPDEGLYTTIAQEMLSGGDWLVPTAPTFWVVGPSEWATRL